MDSDKGNQNVTSVILNILSLGAKVNIFESFVNRPNKWHLENELLNLQKYKMIGPNHELTLLGRRVNEMSADPLVAKMMLFGSIFGCGRDMGIVSAGLSNAHLFPMPQGHRETKKNRKRQEFYKPPTRSELTGQLSLSSTSDGLSIVGAIRKFQAANDKVAFCQRFLLDQKSVEEVLHLCGTIAGEMEKLKGPPQRELSLRFTENLMAGAFLPNVAYTK